MYERVIPADVPVVAFVGDPGQGKDTACNLLQRVMSRRRLVARRYAFADKLKAATDTLWPAPPGPWTRRALWNAVGDAARMVDPDTFVRHVSRAMKEDFDDSVHSVTLYDRMPTPDMAIVTDARFVNEFAWLDAQGAEYVALKRIPEDNYLTELESTHPSAVGWRALVALRPNVNWCPNHTEEDTEAWLEQFIDTMGWFDGRDYYRSHGRYAFGAESQATD